MPLACCIYCGRDTRHKSGICWHCVSGVRRPYRTREPMPWEIDREDYDSDPDGETEAKEQANRRRETEEE